MACTRRFIGSTVGVKGANLKGDVRSLQELLIAAGIPVKGGADGGWGDGTRTALGQAVEMLPAGTAPVKDLVAPGDYLLLYLAWKAGILIPLPRKAGIAGVLALHDRFVAEGTRYNAGAEKGAGNRAVWGVHDRLDYAVQTTSGRFHAGPIEMDCTTYVNLMLSVYASGHCHNDPYAASCANFGGVSPTHCARDRYGMALVTRKAGSAEARHFEGAAQIADAVGTRTDKLFAIEVATKGTGMVTHMVLLYDGKVYECTTGQTASACIVRPLAEFCASKTNKIYYVFGPNLATR